MVANEGYSLEADLEQQELGRPTLLGIQFEVDARKRCLLNGLDDIGITLEDAELISALNRAGVSRPWYFASRITGPLKQ